MLAKVISGGQNGADVAALKAAKRVGLDVGGWMPKGFKTLDGPNPERAWVFNLQEHSSPNYPPRTYLNVKESDATLRLAYNFNSPGERCTWKAIQKYDKNWADTQIYEGWVIQADPQEVADWIKEDDIEILNVAGNGNSLIEDCVYKFLLRVFLLSINSVTK